jgi:predicted ATP-grasp superfamily ATP-dependent carboligase
MRILVTNCHTRMGYAVATSLAAAGHQIIAAARRIPSMVAALPGVIAQIAYPDPFIDSEAFLQSLSDAATRWQADVIFPVHEETFVLAKYRARFANYLLLAPELPALLQAHDKLSAYHAALQNGVAAPLTIAVNNEHEVRAAVAECGWPAIIKPRFGSGANQVRCLRDQAALDAWLTGWGGTEALLVQRFVVGCGAGFGALVWQGRIIASAGHIRLREVPIAGGTSTARCTFRHAAMERAAHSILQDSGLDGVGMVEFRYDADQDQFAFLEINPRYWGGVATGIEAGVAFPVLHLACELGQIAPDSEIVRPQGQIESRWLMGEVRAAFELANARRWRDLREMFRRVPANRLALDDFSWKRPGVFTSQFLAYMDGLLQQRSFGGHSQQKDHFFSRESGQS